ncbi:MAG: phospholipase D-like domain-containing protein [Myxococcaceae bacterium]
MSAEPEIRLLNGGAEAFPRMIEAIDRARELVHLEIYTFDTEGWGAKFIAALTNAARRGVKVKVIVDGWGSFTTARILKESLRAAGTQVTVYNPLTSFFIGKLWRNHRKILLVDEEVAFLGGINIHDDYANAEGRLGWADLAVELRGSSVSYLAHRLRNEPYSAKPGPVKVFLSGLRGGRRLRRRYVRAIGSARTELLIAHAYFLPDRHFIRSITAAARRGVKVRLLLAGKSDVALAQAATMRLYRKFLAAGVEIHEWTASTLHAKTAVVDGRLALLGSFNLDPLSLVNLETLVEVDDPAIATGIAHWVRDHIDNSRRVTPESCARTGFQRFFVDWVSLFFASVIESAAHFIGGSPKPRRQLPSGKR